MKTYHAKPGEVEREWVIIDAEDQVLRSCGHQGCSDSEGQAQAAVHPHVDTGDFVIIINADKVKVTGTKAATKTYYRHSGFPGGLKQETFTEAMTKHPGARHRACRQGHAAEEHAGPCDGQETEGVRRR